MNEIMQDQNMIIEDLNAELEELKVSFFSLSELLLIGSYQYLIQPVYQFFYPIFLLVLLQ